LDISTDARTFAVAGSDTFVYVYDEHTKEKLMDLKEGGRNLPGHSNRIFTVKFHP
jgi:COMPASS component SWD3